MQKITLRKREYENKNKFEENPKPKRVYEKNKYEDNLELRRKCEKKKQIHM